MQDGCAVNESLWLDQRLRAAMLRFAKLHIQPLEEAEDAVQDTLLALMERSDRLVGVQDIKPYVFGILKNKITDRLRRKYRVSEREVAVEMDDMDHVLFQSNGNWVKELAPATWNSPEEQLNSDQFFAVVDACVNDLPEKIARVFSMKELLDCDADEVCSILNLTQSDYWQCMSRARKRLQMCLNARWFESSSRGGEV